MTTINPRKLLRSKWTAAAPKHREKHFIISKVEYDEAGAVTECMIEAVHSGREISLDWRELRVTDVWLQGWQ